MEKVGNGMEKVGNGAENVRSGMEKKGKRPQHETPHIENNENEKYTAELPYNLR